MATTVAESRRLFFAIAPDDSARSVLAAHLSTHLPDGVPVKPVPAVNWHVTLRFLGSTAPAEADRVVHEASRRLGRGGFEARLGGLGAFPHPGRAAVLWVGFTTGADILTDLAARCEDVATSVGFPPEDRSFHPHLTLARIRPPGNVATIVGSVPPLDLSFDVSEVLLYESHLGPDGARYEVAERFPF